MTFLSFALAKTYCFAISWRRVLFIAVMTMLSFIALGMISPVTHALELDRTASIIQEGAAVKHALITDSSRIPDSFESSQCMALLKRIHYNNVAPNHTIQNHRATGQAAALGLVLGLRFALGPKEVHRHKSDRGPHFQIWQAEDYNGAQALAVADYRRCKNREALQALSDFRWER